MAETNTAALRAQGGRDARALTVTCRRRADTARIRRGAGVVPRARAVVAWDVGHQQFQLPAGRQLLRQRAVAKRIDVVALVAAGGDEADALRLAHARAFDASSWR